MWMKNYVAFGALGHHLLKFILRMTLTEQKVELNIFALWDVSATPAALKQTSTGI